DFRGGVLRRRLVWRTPTGKRVQVVSSRMVSMVQRHVAVMTLEVTMLTGSAPVVISSQLINRQDGLDDFGGAGGDGDGMADRRKAGAFEGRVILPPAHSCDDGRMVLGYRWARSRMTVAVAAEHRFDGPDHADLVLRASEDQTKAVYRFDAA